MGDQNGERVVPEDVDSRSAAPPQPPADQAQVLAAQDQALAAQAQALAAQAHAFATEAQAHATEAQAHATEAQAPADQAEAPAERTQTPADQAQALAAQAQALAAQAHAFATEAHAFATEAQALATEAQALLASNNTEDALEKSVPAYKTIANLHDINLHYPIHKLALEDWQRTEEYLSNRVSRRQGRSAELTNQIYNIFGWFAVFQGVVLTAVSQLTQTANTEEGGVPLCGKIWCPIVLTVLATVATIVGIFQKFRSLRSLESTIHTERVAQIEIARRASCLRREGPKNFKFHRHTDDSRLATKVKPFWINRLLVIVALLIFTCFFILSYFVILCDTAVYRKWDGGLHR